MTIRILVADDHTVFRSGLRALLQREADLEIVGEAGCADEVLERLQTTQSDVLLLDLAMPGGLSGPQLAEAAAKAQPAVRVVVLTMHEDTHYLREMFRVGVHGYVLKKSGIEDVLRAIRAAALGEFYVDSALGGLTVSSLLAQPAPVTEAPGAVLTAREREVCRWLALGYTNAEVGRELFISERTVESHRTSIMAKLQLPNRAGLVRFALDSGLIK
ncbi:MAG TPA: response regulator transcription factor [Polyangiales bacterium]